MIGIRCARNVEGAISQVPDQQSDLEKWLFLCELYLVSPRLYMGQNEIKSLYEKRVKTAKHHPDSA